MDCIGHACVRACACVFIRHTVSEEDSIRKGVEECKAINSYAASKYWVLNL